VTALALIGFAAATLWLTHGPSALRLIMRPGQNGEFFEQLAIMGACCSTSPAGLDLGAAQACGEPHALNWVASDTVGVLYPPPARSN
jgi:hypothetical protein